MDVLICHDGELADVCATLRELSPHVTERLGPPPLAELTRGFDLVVATPARALRLARLLERPETRSIVVAESGTRTAGRRLHQLGVEWIVRRPVHPAALRLLLQHALYRGPERRRTERVSVGLPIRYRAAWLPRRAVLRELSLRGASLITSRRVTPGRRITLRVPGAGWPLALRGEVVRCRPLAPGQLELGIALDPHPANPLPVLRHLVERYARGPATCVGAALAPVDGSPPEPGGAAGECRAADRREATRHPFVRRVIAMGDEAPRVLIGRDLSLGGMRVEAGAVLEPGQRLKLALHVRAGEIPLVVEAEVLRSDASGSGLRFASLGDSGRCYLAKMLDALPALVAPSQSGEEERRVLAEVVESFAEAPGGGAR
jgi:hypothetical protein